LEWIARFRAKGENRAMNMLVRIVEDDASLAEAIGELLASVRIDAVHFPDVDALLARDDRDRPGCLILDVRLPGMSGMEFLRRAEQFGILLPAVFISAHGDIAMGVSAMKAGAVDFLPKPFNDQALLDAVSVALDRDAARRERDAERDTIRLREQALTPREREVFALVVAGRRNREVADILALSEVTVKMHRGAMMRKMEAETIIDLVRMAGIIAEKVPA
jgi:FixJ family two-component response regulator